MGCDIHMMMEIRLRCEQDDEHGGIAPWRFYKPCEGSRNYDVFAKIAGVRGDANGGQLVPDSRLRAQWDGSDDALQDMIAEKVLPEDITTMSLVHLRHYGIDAHTIGVLNRQEIATLYSYCRRRKSIGVANGPTQWKTWADEAFDYVFSEEARVDVSTKHCDVRVIFWFDN